MNTIPLELCARRYPNEKHNYGIRFQNGNQTEKSVCHIELKVNHETSIVDRFNSNRSINKVAKRTILSFDGDCYYLDFQSHFDNDFSGDFTVDTFCRLIINPSFGESYVCQHPNLQLGDIQAWKDLPPNILSREGLMKRKCNRTIVDVIPNEVREVFYDNGFTDENIKQLGTLINLQLVEIKVDKLFKLSDEQIRERDVRQRAFEIRFHHNWGLIEAIQTYIPSIAYRLYLILNVSKQNRYARSEFEELINTVRCVGQRYIPNLTEAIDESIEHIRDEIRFELNGTGFI